MRRKILMMNIVTSLVVLILMFATSVYLNEKDNERYAMDNVEQYALTYQSQFEKYGELAVPESVTYRVTVMKLDGTVLFDNDVDSVETMDNHLERPEVQAAIVGEPEAELRYSDTLDMQMIYYALTAEYEGEVVVIRLALSIESVQVYFNESAPILIAVLILIGILGILMSLFFGKQSLKPLERVKHSLEAVNKGEYNHIMAESNDEEINSLLDEINEINRSFVRSFAKVQSEQIKLDYVLNNIADGIVAINGRNQISTINKSAQEIFSVSQLTIGKPIEYLSGSERFIAKMNNDTNQIFELEIEKKIYLCLLNFLDKPTNSFNRVLVIRDITARKQSENMRSEFFANASHELKTPLTVVCGFVEILALSEQNEKNTAMLEKIIGETQRMKTLIEDMLELSNLENTSVVSGEVVRVSKVCEEVFETLSIESYKKNIRLKCDGDAKIACTEKHLYELLKNLVENGVKYNNRKKHGVVNVYVSKKGDDCKIVVLDNGIGIDKKHQDRIFERFYRVEKSRSRATGGTGLGLSIVKHIVDLYGGTISLSSAVERGTTISVTFPGIVKKD